MQTGCCISQEACRAVAAGPTRRDEAIGRVCGLSDALSLPEAHNARLLAADNDLSSISP